MTTLRTITDLEEIEALASTDLGRTDWLEITQERVNTFADATGDHQWIHVDPSALRWAPSAGPSHTAT